MTDKYIPGRIYSGRVDNGPREYLFVNQFGQWRSVECKYIADSVVTDVRGPLVVLDLDASWPDVCNVLRRHVLTVALADQIEQQTRPPLHEGVHLAFSRSEGRRQYMRWDGDNWWHASGELSHAHWDSVRFIGPAGDDA